MTRPQRSFTADEITHAIARRFDGLSPNAIGRETGRDGGAIRKMLKRELQGQELPPITRPVPRIFDHDRERPCPIAIADRDRRALLMHLTPGAALMGDPLPGCSALERGSVMAGWFNTEERKLREMWAVSTDAEIQAAIPRHDLPSLKRRAVKLGLPNRLRRRRPATEPKHPILVQLRDVRLARGISQSALAPIAGCNRITFIKCELRGQWPSLRILTRWCDALGFELVLRAKGETPCPTQTHVDSLLSEVESGRVIELEREMVAASSAAEYLRGGK